MSFLAWIDFDQKDRERAWQVMKLFSEEDSRDELGIGSVRDGLSDLMFPGTSTIQTRLRYMMFVPWIYSEVADQSDRAENLVRRAREAEVRLISALMTGGEKTGVIGSEAGETLKRLPSDIYWAGLGVLGIRRYQGSRLDFLSGRVGELPWAAGLPTPESGFLERTNFHLRPQEADFLIDRLIAGCPDSLLTELARTRATSEYEFVWELPDRGEWSEEHRLLVDHAKRFSFLMHGAALLYNLQLAELAERSFGDVRSTGESKVEDYSLRLETWRGGLDQADLADWDLDNLWERLKRGSIRIPTISKVFVEEWRRLTTRPGGGSASDSAARDLIQLRETRLKRGKSRFLNQSALARWNGASGTARLNYRWPVVRNHLKDLADAV